MKNTLVAFLLLITAVNYGWAQQRRPMERIHAAKIAYITDRLHLTTEQATGFVPLYSEYEGEIKTTRKAYFVKGNGRPGMDADYATARQYIDDNLDYQQKVIEIKRKYNDRFLKVISAQQLAELYVAEREFKQLLKKRLEQRRAGGNGRLGRTED